MILRLVDLFEYLSVVLRAATLMWQSLVLGGALFLLWIASESPCHSTTKLLTVRRSSSNLLSISAAGLAITQVLSLYLSSAVLMATAEIGFRGVIGANFFAAGICVVVAAIGTVLVMNRPEKIRSRLLPLLAAIILSGSVATDHAAARVTGRPALIALTFLHQACAGFWIGGLLFLIVALFRSKDRATQWYLLRRFSRIAVVSVCMLFATGLLMSGIYIGTVAGILGAAYGVMVSAKILMLAVLMLLGGINFLLLRNGAPATAIPRVRRTIEAEFGIGIAAIFAAASLTSQPPAIDLGPDIVPLRTIVTRFTPARPKLTYPSNITLSSQRQSNRAAPSKTEGKVMNGEFLSYKELSDIQESEANHHWMGLIVLTMGVLALLAKTGRMRWAEFWPLSLIGISAFIFLRADTESWPYGPKSFWAASLLPEVFQHRLAALACIGFAIFELRVRKHKLIGAPSALVFPIMCALGGVVLLTHSHSITNAKEELLAELSHVPLGLLAVSPGGRAGWRSECLRRRVVYPPGCGRPASS